MLARVALITGASRGIGRSIAHRLSKDGFHVLPRLSMKSKKGRQAAIHLADVSVETDVKAMIAETGKLGSLDVVGAHFSTFFFTTSLFQMVANAGITNIKPFLDSE